MVKSKVVLAKNMSINEFIKLLDQLHLFSFLNGGQKVLIKPNVNTDDPYPGTSNPDLLEEIVRKLYDKGASEVLVGDSSSIVARNTRLNMIKVGIEKATLNTGGKIIIFEEGKWIKVKPEGAIHWRSGFNIPEVIQKVDHLVNLTVIKTHFIANYTGALKNLVGCIKRIDRIRLHLRNIGIKIAEINLAFNPVLNILDARKVFVKGGPRRGELKEANMLIASNDRIAADVVGLAILKMLGTTEKIQKKSVWKQDQIKRAVDLRIGAEGADQIEIEPFNLGENELQKIKENLG